MVFDIDMDIIDANIDTDIIDTDINRDIIDTDIDSDIDSDIDANIDTDTGTAHQTQEIFSSTETPVSNCCLYIDQIQLAPVK